jgi:CubicO group peptidase (beta-lactamase class C family)
MSISGTCDPRFARVRGEFERNFRERGEVGASVCVTLAGETVVDLWGGTARVDTGAPWQKDTVVQVWSCTKGATALCAHILAARGLLDIDAPVVQYWPEFGRAGKEQITVKMLLTHQAGLPELRGTLPQGAFYDWKYMVTALQDEAPFWEPGTRQGYHSATFGWLVGEVVRRISGKSLGTFFHDEVAAPLGLDFWIGLPEEVELRVALLIPDDPPSFDYGEWDSRAARAAEIPAMNGITNGRGLAGMYAPLASVAASGACNGWMPTPWRACLRWPRPPSWMRLPCAPCASLSATKSPTTTGGSLPASATLSSSPKRHLDIRVRAAHSALRTRRRACPLAMR